MGNLLDISRIKERITQDISSYNKGINTGTDNDVTGTLYERSALGTGGSVVLFK